MDWLGGDNIRNMAVHRGISRLKFSLRCAEASAVQAYIKNVGICSTRD